ncbi:MAG: T9SS type A sorting domain-containing protein [Bacteroidetes bacterium]|nr:T9SS type A sorting domain-containing protein [Bacteroidota bacterium]
MRFSLSGKYLASGMYGMKINGLYNHNRADIYDFNRCDGSINYKQYYMTPMDTSSYWDWDHKFDICFSGNDSLLYMSHQYTIYQIDLSDTNINNGLFIHGPDTLLDYFPLYHLMGLHRGFKQTYNQNLKTPPNMANYGLGKDTTKICWPLSQTESEVRSAEWVVYPNPSSIVFIVQNKHGKKKDLYNVQGELLFSTKEDVIDVKSYAKGIYYLQVEGQVKKVIIE